jgi:hypothetical protein
LHDLDPATIPLPDDDALKLPPRTRSVTWRIKEGASDQEIRNTAANQRANWIEACNDEMASIGKMGTWTLDPRPQDANVIGSKWTFDLKTNALGQIERFKARIETLRLITGIAAAKNWSLSTIDIKTAFLNGDLAEDIYIHQPKGYEVPGNLVCHLRKALYGLRQAGHQ